jgi:hypothetical protein
MCQRLLKSLPLLVLMLAFEREAKSDTIKDAQGNIWRSPISSW